MKKKVLVFLGLLVLFMPAQVKMTLPAAIQYALSHSPEILAAEKSFEATKANARKAASLFLPTASLQGQDILKEKVFTIELPPFFPGDRPKRVKMDFTRKYQFGFNITQPIFTGGKLINTYSISQLQAKAAEMELKQKKLDLEYRVKQAFYSVLLAKKMYEIQQESSKLAYRHYKQVKALYDVGSATKFELLQAKVNWENTKPELLRAENNLTLAKLALKNVLGMDKDVEVVGELKYFPLEISIKELEQYLINSCPSLLAMRYRREAAAKNIALAKAQFAPTVALTFNYNFRSENFNFKARNWEDYYTLALSFSMPLFSGYSRVEDVRAAVSRYHSAKFGEEALKKGLLLRLHSAYRKAKEAQASYFSAKDTLEEAREGVRLAEINYREGLITSLQVEQARLALKTAEINLYNALYQYSVSIAEIENITGYKFGGEK